MKRKSKKQIRRPGNYNKNVKKFKNSREQIIKLYNDYAKNKSEVKYKAKYAEGLKILTPNQMFQRLPIALAQSNQKKLLKEYITTQLN